ncbi:MAG: GGDEF domain-containing protein [Clostridia bacterium]|nr:GGDEF domain-containing protein [Clostridia bacterium]
MYKNIIDRMNDELITGNEFRSLLNTYLSNTFGETVKIQYILSDKDKYDYTYGVAGKGREQLSKVCKLEDDYELQIKIWQDNHELTLDICEELFKAYWNNNYCDSVCGLPATDRGVFTSKCDKTIEKWQKNEKNIAFVMMDLDNFKQVNSKHGYNIGTDVISEFSRILFKAIDGKGILIHQNGDEFDLLFTYEKYTQIIELLHLIYIEVKKHKFYSVKDLDLTMAIGVYIITPEEQTNFLIARGKAEAAYHPKEKNGTKQRNSIRIVKDKNFPFVRDDILETGLLRVLANVYNENLFHNIFLDYISYMVSNIVRLDEIQDKVKTYLDWINPTYDSKHRSTAFCEKWDTSISLSYFDIILACLQGLLKNNNIAKNNLSLKIDKNDIQINIEGETILHYCDSSICGSLSWSHKKNTVLTESVKTNRSVLVLAGYTTELNLPKDVFYKIVKVDARPFLGGGLPDLWAATLSELINCMKENPNFNDIAIFGDFQNTKNVIEYLTKISLWDASKMQYISKKTYKPYRDVLEFKDKFSNHINTFNDEKNLIKHVFECHKSMNDLIASENERNMSSNRFMKRVLPNDHLKLEIIDGCKTDTISHAFPIVLEILRGKLDKTKVIIDQAGRQLLELTDFKILLENPQKDKLPEYYLSDREILDDYYNSVFIEPEGLFRKRIDKNDQLQETINHVVLAISGEKKYATRRAILIVDNEITHGNYSPLGLVSIWLTPRFVNDNVVIDYSYTWRTVEAIVGLPLSLYASVKFAEYLTNIIKEKAIDKSGNIELGQVSYIAHSLHMFTDEEGMNIVRGIINEVSV